MSDAAMARISLQAAEETVRQKHDFFPHQMLAPLLDWVVVPEANGTAPVAFGHKELGHLLWLAEGEARKPLFVSDMETDGIYGYRYSQGARQKTVEADVLVHFARGIARHAVNQYKAIGEQALKQRIADLEFDLNAERNYIKALRRNLDKYEPQP
jgi:hypothetical protein